ncbi:hypothetical protein IC617_08280 [Neiella sp. HB171785]|uniref:Uncharacterized protein n=1 Tax=Neiella litorisoli TaxID=2771431 RepID=A0A8J6QQJ3_9GAMM|nr:zinc-finger-containing protein [Neiella litorisoli]MBD1389421.1 hypothetical protein [Neiella litorisoli]
MKLGELNIWHVINVQLKRSGWERVDRYRYIESLRAICEAHPSMLLYRLDVPAIQQWIEHTFGRGLKRAYIRFSLRLLHDYRSGFKTVPVQLTLTCPYCNGKAHLKDSAQLYGGRSFGLAYICENHGKGCDSYVGIHQDDHMPLGRLANSELRKAKQRCHQVFDPIWKQNLLPRNKAYARIAEQMQIARSECHIGALDERLAQQFASAAQHLYRSLSSYHA